MGLSSFIDFSHSQSVVSGCIGRRIGPVQTPTHTGRLRVPSPAFSTQPDTRLVGPQMSRARVTPAEARTWAIEFSERPVGRRSLLQEG